MNAAIQAEVVERILSRAAELCGDVTPSVLQRFYRRHPQALAAFEKHGGANRAQLEGEMVQQALYCLLYWVESPGEIEILLSSSVPHHHDTLQVWPEWYGGLIEATGDVVAETIPPENTEELRVWQQLQGELLRLVDSARQWVLHPDRQSPEALAGTE